MKYILLSSLLLFVFLKGYSQINKFSVGDIGIRYQLDYNGAGSLQNQVSFSGFVSKHLELGGTVSLVYNISRVNYSGYANLPHSASNDTLYNYVTNITTWSYALGFSPYLFYHFRFRKSDFYAGGLLWFGISENSSNTNTDYIADYYSSLNNINYHPALESVGSELANPPTFSFGVGPVIGFQYFFTKNIALGVQAGLIPCAYFGKSNSVVYMSDSWGPNFSFNAIIVSGNQGSTSLNNPRLNAYAGVTLSYYVPRKRGNENKTEISKQQ